MKDKKFENLMKEHKELVQGVFATLGVVVVLVLLFVVSDNIGDRSNDKLGSDSSSQQEEENKNPLLEDGQVLDENQMKEMDEITLQEFKDLIKKKTTTVVILASETCYWCQQQKPILENVLYENDLDVKYLDVSKLTSDEDYEYLEGLHDDLKGFGTPTFISIRNKKVQKVSPNAKSKTQLLEMFKDMGILKDTKE